MTLNQSNPLRGPAVSAGLTLRATLGLVIRFDGGSKPPPISH